MVLTGRALDGPHFGWVVGLVPLLSLGPFGLVNLHAEEVAQGSLIVFLLLLFVCDILAEVLNVLSKVCSTGKVDRLEFAESFFGLLLSLLDLQTHAVARLHDLKSLLTQVAGAGWKARVGRVRVAEKRDLRVKALLRRAELDARADRGVKLGELAEIRVANLPLCCAGILSPHLAYS